MKKHIKLAYNVWRPYFSMSDGNIDKDTIDGIVMGSFIKKYDLTSDWTNLNFTWGSKGPDGTFNGVVGRVGELNVFLFLILFSGRVRRCRRGTVRDRLHRREEHLGGLLPPSHSGGHEMDL